MAKFQQRITARELRHEGRSINEIAESIKVSKGSISLWCRDILLTEKQSEKLSQNKFLAGSRGRFLGAESNRRKKVEMLESCLSWSKDILNSFTERDLLIAGTALYWAEGSKAETTSGFVFVNSDPIMIKLMHLWLKKVMKVQKKDIKPRLAINEMHKPRIDKVLRFWSVLLGLPVSQFGNPWYVKVKVNKVYENYDSYYGILRLGVKKSGLLKHRTLSLIKKIGRASCRERV